VGLLQYLTPSLHFLLGVLVFAEPMPTARWIGFATIWAALVLFTADSARHRRRRRHLPLPGEASAVESSAV
jgi:chloramphenicol-sensitive protein RarD